MSGGAISYSVNYSEWVSFNLLAWVIEAEQRFDGLQVIDQCFFSTFSPIKKNDAPPPANGGAGLVGAVQQKRNYSAPFSSGEALAWRLIFPFNGPLCPLSPFLPLPAPGPGPFSLTWPGCSMWGTRPFLGRWKPWGGSGPRAFPCVFSPTPPVPPGPPWCACSRAWVLIFSRRSCARRFRPPANW